MDVSLNVFTDREHFNASADVTATRPGDGDGAEICVTDDGLLMWSRDFSVGHETITWDPEYRCRIADPHGLAVEVVAAVIRALRQCQPA
jgi:hypothetical protein